MDWMGIISSELAEEEKMSSLAVGFSVRMRKQVTSSEGKTTPDLMGNDRGDLL